MNGPVDRTTRFGAIAVSLAFALSACGGHGSTAIPQGTVTKPSSKFGQAVFTMHWPSKTRAKGQRKPDFVSPSALSVSIEVNSEQQLAQVTNKPANGGFSTLNIDAPLGTDTFLVKTFDEPDGQGNVLGQTQISQGIQPNVLNTIGATIDGICTQIGLNFVPTNTNYVEAESIYGQPVTVLVGTLPQQIIANPEDIDGNVIMSPGFVPTVTLSQSNGSNLQFTSTGNNTFAVSAVAAMPENAAESVTGSSLNCSGSAGQPTPQPGQNATSLAIATKAALVFAEGSSQFGPVQITDQDGNVITPQGFPNSSACAVETFDNKNGYIYFECVNNNNFQPPVTVQAYDLNGNALALSGQFALPGSQYATLHYVPANDRIYASSSSCSCVQEYDPQGNNVTPANSFQGLQAPGSIAFGLGNLYVTDTSAAAIRVFSLAGASLPSSFPTFSGLGGGAIAFDPTNNAVYVFEAANNLDALSAFSVSTGQEVASLPVPPSGIYAHLAYSGGSDYLYYAGQSSNGMQVVNYYFSNIESWPLPGAFDFQFTLVP